MRIHLSLSNVELISRLHRGASINDPFIPSIVVIENTHKKTNRKFNMNDKLYMDVDIFYSIYLRIITLSL